MLAYSMTPARPHTRVVDQHLTLRRPSTRGTSATNCYGTANVGAANFCPANGRTTVEVVVQ